MSVDRSAVENIGLQLFEVVAQNFPVASTSDEFYYFPQVQPDCLIRNPWDRFNEDAISDMVKKLSAVERQVALSIAGDPEPASPDLEARIDLSLVQRVTRTLIEQLTEIRAWETQPTLHLTIACIGMAEAMDSQDPAIKHDRARGLPDFFDNAGKALRRVPVLFRDLGLEMIDATRNYLIFLQKQVPALNTALGALDRFEHTLLKVATRSNFLLPVELVERIVGFHLNCNLTLPEINQVLDQEIHEMQTAISDFSGSPAKDLSRSTVFDKIPLPEIGKEGLLGLYRAEVSRLAKHCLENELISPGLFRTCPVRVESVPSYLSATRTASSYSIPPRHPPTNGKFYVINADDMNEARKVYQREYRILSAHETYPGHHLLDSYRWNHDRPIRRSIEQPLFYEGWACFAEEIMRQTGYFNSPGERLLVARRRLWRAIRGKVDLGLQTGAMDLKMAAVYLGKTGIDVKDAISVVRKYPLNPGYQLCYTVGLHHFLDLYQRYGQQNLKKFVAAVLSRGEIDFKDLESLLRLNVSEHL
jgi:hypothetical protein